MVWVLNHLIADHCILYAQKLLYIQSITELLSASCISFILTFRSTKTMERCKLCMQWHWMKSNRSQMYFFDQHLCDHETLMKIAKANSQTPINSLAMTEEPAFRPILKVYNVVVLSALLYTYEWPTIIQLSRNSITCRRLVLVDYIFMSIIWWIILILRLRS